MSNMQQGQGNTNGGYGGYGNNAPAANGDMSAFWAEVGGDPFQRLAGRHTKPFTDSRLLSQVTSVQDLLKEYNDNISHVSNLQQRSLNNIDDQQASQQLDQIAASNRKLSNQLKQRIKALQSQGGDSRDGQTRRQQVSDLRIPW